MKNVCNYLFLSCLLFLALFCSCTEEANYLRVIPANATLVTSFDIASIVNKTEISEKSVSDFVRDKLDVNLNDVPGFSEILKNPGEVGVDWSAPIYTFKTIDGLMWAVLKLSDSDMFSLYLDVLSEVGISTSAKEDDGLYTARLGGVEMFFDDSALLVCLPHVGISSVSVRGIVKTFFQHSEKTMFVNTDKYKKMTSKSDGSDVVMYNSINNLKGKLELIACLSLEDDKIAIGAEFYSAEGVLKELLDGLSKNTFLLNGRFMNVAYYRPFLWVGMGINGEYLLKLLKTNADMKSILFALERGIDVDMMIKSIKGDAVLAIPEIPQVADGVMPVFSFLSDLKNSDFLGDVDYWMKSMKDYGMSMDCRGGNQYTLKKSDLRLNWGVDNDVLFLSTDRTFANVDMYDKATVLDNYRTLISENKLFVYLDLNALVSRNEVRNVVQMVCSVFNYGVPDCAIVTSGNFKDFNVNILFK